MPVPPYPNLRYTDLASGIRTEFGTLIPPGARLAAYVRSTGPQSGEDMDIRRLLLPTLNQALARCRSGAGDYVIVLPGHVESVSTADQMSNLVAGTKIIGCGSGVTRPTFTWTSATSTFLLDVSDAEIVNCVLNLDGGTTGTTTAAPITMSAAGCAIKGCTIRMGTDASNNVTIGITTTAAADDCVIADNLMYGATAAECTTMIQLVGADRLKFLNNYMTGATSATAVGPVRFLTTDSTNVVMLNNYVRNNKAASTAAVTVGAGATSSSGFVDNLQMTVLGDAANQLVLGNAVGAWAASVGLFTFGRYVNVANTFGERVAEVTLVSA